MNGVFVLRFALALGAGMNSGLAGAQWAQQAKQEKLPMVAREIKDARDGSRWLLLKNAGHPGGPGRLVQAPQVNTVSQTSPSGEQATLQTTATGARRRPVIFAGERLMIEDETPIARMRIEAIAMMPAAVGEVFKVRLSIGAATATAIALGPGRAKLAPVFEGRP